MGSLIRGSLADRVPCSAATGVAFPRYCWRCDPAASALEERHLLPGPLDKGVQAEEGLELREIERIAGGERRQMIPLDDVPVVALNCLSQERRALELVANELRPLRGDD